MAKKFVFILLITISFNFVNTSHAFAMSNEDTKNNH